MEQRKGIWEVVTWNTSKQGWRKGGVAYDENVGKSRWADPDENLTFHEATARLAMLAKINEAVKFKLKRKFPAPDMDVPEAERRAWAVVELNFKAHFSNYAVMYDEDKKVMVDAPELITRAEALLRWADYQKRFAPTMFIVQSFA